MEVGLADRQHDHGASGRLAALALDVDGPFIGAEPLQPARYFCVTHEMTSICRSLLPQAIAARRDGRVRRVSVGGGQGWRPASRRG